MADARRVRARLRGRGGRGAAVVVPAPVHARHRPAPWREIALGLLATGLLLAPGWSWGRRLGQLAAVLATAALPVAAGILVVDGLRGRPLLAMLAAFVFTAGLLALLTSGLAVGSSPPPPRVAAAAGLYGVARFGLVDEPAPAPGGPVGRARACHER